MIWGYFTDPSQQVKFHSATIYICAELVGRKMTPEENIEVEVHEVPKEEPMLKDDVPGEKEASQDVDPGISAVAQFDQLVANRGVLTTSEAEGKFLDFVKGNAIVSNSLRADRAEAEQEHLCQRVALANQEAAKLRAALEKTRLELQVVVDKCYFYRFLWIS